MPNAKSDFSANDTIKCIQQLKAHNPLLQELKYTIPDSFADSYLTKDIWSYITFHLDEIQLKNQGDWPILETLYKDQIATRLKSIECKIDIALNGNGWDKLLGKKPNAKDFQWTLALNEILLLATKGDYAAFHVRWNNWKEEHGDTKETIDINLSIMLDWLDETLLLYANSIKAANLADYSWIDAYPNQTMFCPGYALKLDIVANDKQKQHKAFEEKWAIERAESHAKQLADTQLLAIALEEDVKENAVSLTL